MQNSCCVYNGRICQGHPKNTSLRTRPAEQSWTGFLVDLLRFNLSVSSQCGKYTFGFFIFASFPYVCPSSPLNFPTKQRSIPDMKRRVARPQNLSPWWEGGWVTTSWVWGGVGWATLKTRHQGKAGGWYAIQQSIKRYWHPIKRYVGLGIKGTRIFKIN